MERNRPTLNAHLQLFDALSDNEVIARVLAGDHPLYELLMRRYNRRLFRLCRGILSDDLLAQDAVQEAYVAAFEHLNQFQGPDGFGAWLMRITSRKALRMARKESFLHLVGVSLEGERIPAEHTDEPEHAAIDSETANLLEQAIDRLPRDFRVVLILRLIEGMSTLETAEALELNPATVKTRLHRAKSLLRAHFKHRLDELRPLAYPFAGVRCDAIVQEVFRTLGQH